MYSDPVFNSLSGDLHRFPIGILVHIDVAPIGGRRLPFQFGQLLLAIGSDESRFGPIGPVGSESIAGVANDEIKFFRAGYINVNVDGKPWRRGVDHFRLKLRLLSGNASTEGQKHRERGEKTLIHENEAPIVEREQAPHRIIWCEAHDLIE